MNTEAAEVMYQYEKPTAMDRQLDVLQCHPDGGLLLGASCLTGQYWLGSLWFYQDPNHAPDVDSCTAGVQLEAGVGGAQWVDSTHVLVGLDTGGVAVWRLEDDYHTFVLAQSAAGHDGVVTSVSVTSDSARAVSAAHDRCIKIWDLPTTSLISSTKAHSDIVSCVDCHPIESDMFLSCAQDNRILLWDRRKPKPASLINKSLVKHTVTSLRWQPGNGNKFAVGSESGQVALLDIRAGVENFLVSQAHDRPVYSLQFCAEKPSLLASVGEDCRTIVTAVDEADDMKQIYTDVSHQDFVHGLAWPSLSKLYTCAWDARVMCHEPQSGRAPSILGQALTQVGARGGGDVREEGEGTPPKLTNGDIAGHAGDNSGGIKGSYSHAVKAAQEIKAEG